jgi:hypothetical protein
LGTTTAVVQPKPFNTQTQKRAKYYNGKLYYESTYYINTTPITSNYWETRTAEIGPNGRPSTSSSTLASQSGGCLWAGAAGIIIASNDGQIATTF